MKRFQFTEKVNANTKLKFAHKVILNYILSYQENNQTFHATDKYIGEVYGVCDRTIKRIIADLKSFNLLIVEVDRKKHTTGAGEWYNKRYIKVDLENLESLLNNQTTQEPINTEIVQQIEANEAVNNDSILVDEYEIDDEAQDEWFNEKLEEQNQLKMAKLKKIMDDSTTNEIEVETVVEDGDLTIDEFEKRLTIKYGSFINLSSLNSIMNPLKQHYKFVTDVDDEVKSQCNVEVNVCGEFKKINIFSYAN